MSDLFTDRLSDYLDGELSTHEQDEMESHLAGCEACSATLLDLQAVVRKAGSLEDRPPTGDLWPEIANRIAVQPRVVPDPAPRSSRRGAWMVTFSFPEALAAGLALILTTAAVTYWLTRSPGMGTLPEPGTRAAESRPGEATGIVPAGLAAPGRDGLGPQTVSDGLQAAALTDKRPLPGAAARIKLDAAIADLTRVLDERRERLNPEILRMLELKLDAVDRAVEDARRALQDNPRDPYLYRHLHQTLQIKMALLRQAAGAAQAAS